MSILNLVLGMALATSLYLLYDVPFESAMMIGLLLYIGFNIGDIARTIHRPKD